jgi:hypothetical protein
MPDSAEPVADSGKYAEINKDRWLRETTGRPDRQGAGTVGQGIQNPRAAPDQPNPSIRHRSGRENQTRSVPEGMDESCGLQSVSQDHAGENAQAATDRIAKTEIAIVVSVLICRYFGTCRPYGIINSALTIAMPISSPA